MTGIPGHPSIPLEDDATMTTVPGHPPGIHDDHAITRDHTAMATTKATTKATTTVSPDEG
jgi:hypothetical protein